MSEKEMKMKKEAEMKMKAENETEKKKEDGAVADSGSDKADGDHADKDEDVALIKKMLKKYMGKGDGADAKDGDAADKKDAEAEEKHEAKDDDKESEADMQMAYEAYGFHKQKHEPEEAAQRAVETMKCAKHLAEKAKAQDAGADGAHDGDADDKKDESANEDKKEGKKDDDKDINEARKEIAKLKGEVSALKESFKATEVKDHIEKVCRESKLSNEATKAFRESLKSVKNKSQVDEMFAIFKAGRESGSVGRTMLENGFAFAVEKTVTKAATGKVGGFGDCKGK